MTVHGQARTGRATRRRRALALVTIAGLGYDAYAHFDLSGAYDTVRNSAGSAISQGLLFRSEGALAILAAVLLAVRPNLLTGIGAFAVAAGGSAALLLYRYVDIGRIGPLPEMYEPVWYPEKTRCLIAMVIAAAAAAGIVVQALATRRR